MTTQTLLYPFHSGQIEPQDYNEDKILFINAAYDPALKIFDHENLDCIQSFKPYFDALSAQKYKASHALNLIKSKGYSLAIINAPKNKIQSDFFIALAISSLKEGGLLITAADNKAGGSRLKKTYEGFGLQEPYTASKNKAKVVWKTVNEYDQRAIVKAINAGQMQMQNNFHTTPGIYGWDKIDKGSQLLTQYIPDDLKGHGADFGCGYGFLSKHILDHAPKIKSLTCIDADKQALECCEKNLENSKTDTTFLWKDLTKQEVSARPYDFIVMNPPFHEGKKADPAIGIDFIKNAHAGLRKKGSLFMVANAQLPYEIVIESLFYKWKILTQEKGYKVIHAEK